MRFPRWFIVVTLAPSAGLLGLLVFYPLAYVVRLATLRFFLADPAVRFVGWANFVAMFQDSRFTAAVGRSVLFTVTSVGLSLALGMILALLLRREGPGTGVFRSLVILPMILTPMVTGAMFRFMMDYDYGAINHILRGLRIGQVPFLGDPNWAFVSVVLVDVWQWTPFMALVLLAGLESLPSEPFEAARIDGASPLSEFIYVTLPLMRRVIAIAVLLRAMDAFREFDKVYIMTGGGPGTATETLAVYVWRNAFQWLNMGYAAAMGLFMIALISIASTLYVKRTRLLEAG